MVAGSSVGNFSLLRYLRQQRLSPTNLSALKSTAALLPAFGADATTYRATVGNDVTHARPSPTLADALPG